MLSDVQTPEPTQALIAVAPALRKRLPALSAAIVARIEQSMPMYRDVRAVDAGSLRESVRQNMEYLLASVISEGPANLSAPARTGQVRARQGVPMAEMLRGFRIGFAQFWEAVAEEIMREGTWSQRDLTETATVLWWTTDEFSAAATEAYRETMAGLSELSERRRSALVEALIQGGGMERGTVWEIASKLGLPRDGLFASVVAEVGEIGVEALPGVATRLREEGIESVWRLQPRMQVGVLSLRSPLVGVPAWGSPLPGSPSAQPEELDVVLGVLTALSVSARIGVSPAYTDLEHTPRAVYLAKIALNSITGPPIEGQPRVQWFAATPLATLVAAAPEAAVQVARTVLGSLLRLPRDEQDLLLDTLEVWLATGGSAKDTAQRTYCHPNTVRHRLRRITEYTGRSVENPTEAAELSTALHALRLLPEVREPPGSAAHLGPPWPRSRTGLG
jgi:PucR C-terminal helix-turn-helix domain/GGDEF-like domain